jgi:hypothetical protein
MVARWAAALLLAGSALSEVWGIPGEWAYSRTAMQRAVVLGELGMIVAGLAGGVGVMLRRRWAVPAAAAWGACVVLAGGLAPRAFGGTPWSVSAVTALVCVLVGLATVLLTWAGLRAPVRRAEVPR